jgi:hypothetical protein
MRTIFAIAAAAAFTAGCGGTGFTAGVTQTVNMHLGKLTSACNTTGASSPVTSSDGSSTSFVHQMQSDVCLITAQWTGPLIDMADLRKEIGKDEPDAEKDLSGLHIKHLDIDVNAVSFRDVADDSVLDAPDTAYRQYHEVLSLPSGDDIVTLDFNNDHNSDAADASSNPNHPQIETPGEVAIEDELNGRLVDGGDITGTGQLTLQLDSARIGDFTSATDPALRMKLDYDVTGGKD